MMCRLMCDVLINEILDSLEKMLNEILNPSFHYPVPGSKMVGSAELRKRKDENKTPIFRVRFTFKPSPLSESPEQATLHTPLAHLP